MKTLLALILTSATLTVAAQDIDLSAVDEIGGSSDAKERIMIQIGFDTWLDAPDTVDVKAGSRTFNIYLMYDIPLSKNFSFAPGFGIGVHNIHTDALIVEDTSRNSVFVPVPSNISYKKNKYTTAFLDVPIELRFRSNANKKGKTFNIAAGFKAGYKMNSHWKYKGKDLGLSGDKVKTKQHDLRNILDYRYGVTGRIGYGGFNLFAYYGLSTFFEDGKGPEMTPMSVGFSFNIL